MKNNKIRKNATTARYCFIGMMMFSALSTILGVLLLKFHIHMLEQGALFGIFILEVSAISITILLLCFGIDAFSEVKVSSEGISVCSKFSCYKELLWSECNFAGAYGHYYGLKGIIVFSPKEYFCYTEKDCRRAASKDKTAIQIEYSAELMYALKKYAPAKLLHSIERFISEK